MAGSETLAQGKQDHTPGATKPHEGQQRGRSWRLKRRRALSHRHTARHTCREGGQAGLNMGRGTAGMEGKARG